MTASSVEHATFTLERVYAHPPARVFAAWANADAKRRWFVDGDGPEWETLSYDLDFRVGGREHGHFRRNGAEVHANETVYLDIAPDRRIVFAYSMEVEERRISASLGTVVLAPEGSGTRLTYTEQATYLDGLDKPAAREGGWGWLLDQLEAALEREAA